MSATAPAQQHIQALYSDHHGWLHGWLRKKLGCTHQAADLAQDVFVRVLVRRVANPAAALHIEEPRAYLSTIARGLVIDHWRRCELERAWLETLAALPEAEAPSPEQQLTILETLVALDRALDALPAAVRQAFLWAQLEGLTCPQIAQRLGVSLATAERYVAKGLRRCYELRFGS
ncbi:RNA polymerase subunit sigma [Diaphorobacter nitroreducens]|uniref:sigma-70 family RNA polymerase sigma factor n=1 Tax=Diaphorobacter nitroreducens TaxID=164759 RepID=UPI000DC72501|nr:sigma-70 family RNA polymerase sigma factor [Diaphorobacter nitroreducens]ASI68632.1 RNA polymerase subunit sigma [Diaphorobacter nitroreducens]